MRKLIIILSLFSLATALFLNSCKNNPLDPIDSPKNPSEYTWTADTLAIDADEIQCLMESVWGTSSNNVYACGHTANHINNFFHYDGNKWSIIKIPDNVPGPLSFSCVTGTSANDIWLAGDRLNEYPTTQATSSPFIAHLNALGTWTEYPLPKYKNLSIGHLYIISPSDIWALGWGTEPALFHFNGANWTLDSLKIPYNPDAHPDILLFSMVTYKSDLYLLATKHENYSANRTFYIYRHISDKWTCIDSSAIDLYKYQEPAFGDRLIVTEDNKLLSYGQWGIYEWYGGTSWRHINPTGCWKMANAYGNKLFAATNDGRICFFDGSALQPIEGFTNKLQIVPRDIWTNGREAFIAGYTATGWPQRSIVWHGR